MKLIRIASPTLRIFIRATAPKYGDLSRTQAFGLAFEEWIEDFERGKLVNPDTGLFAPIMAIPHKTKSTSAQLTDNIAKLFDQIPIEAMIPAYIPAPRWTCRNDALLRFAFRSCETIDGMPIKKWATLQMRSAMKNYSLRDLQTHTAKAIQQLA